jgi:GrpB-like predicted nucleotidyltransferase (UPF0157 family)
MTAMAQSGPDDDAAGYEDRLSKVTIGRPTRLTGLIELSDYDPRWPDAYRLHAKRITHALGPRIGRLEHVGSTSVPGLPAKPVIDIVLEVPDSADEPAFVPDLEAAGYTLKIREPGWFEHRLLSVPAADVNLHVFSAGCVETDRMVGFRDRLRTDASDRELYARTKRELAARAWTHMQQYADAKTSVVGEIMARAAAAP